jgi:RNA polymerase sigma-70 factor, ECF subfamily
MKPAYPQPFGPDGVQYRMGAVAMAEPDTELMLRVKGGDAACFAVLLGKHRAPVVHFLYRMVQNQGIAEELAQEVFLRVYKARATYEPTAKFTTWLFRIATHLAINNLRGRKSEAHTQSLDDNRAPDPIALHVADRHPTIEQKLLGEARLAEIRNAIQTLPPKQRAAVLMHKYEEMNYGQIASVLGCSDCAVKSLLFRAYETLRARLAHMV